MRVLQGQLAVVTGASGGIGGAISIALAEASVNLILMGRDCSKLMQAANRLQQAAVIAEPCVCDLATTKDINDVCDAIIAKHQRLDILVHCAGAIDHGKLADAPISSMDAQYAANIRGPLLLTQRLLPILRKPRGQIVFVNSSTGLNARANAGQFSATQHALKALADSLRDEVNAAGIRVTSIFPGRTATSRIEALSMKEGREFKPESLLQAEDVSKVIVDLLCLPWTAEVTNVSIRPMLKSY